MKKTFNLLKALLMSVLFFCFMQKTDAQCAKKQYAIGVNVNSYEQADPAGNPSYEFCNAEITESVKVFNRVDFTFSQSGEVFDNNTINVFTAYPLMVDFGKGSFESVSEGNHGHKFDTNH